MFGDVARAPRLRSESPAPLQPAPYVPRLALRPSEAARLVALATSLGYRPRGRSEVVEYAAVGDQPRARSEVVEYADAGVGSKGVVLLGAARTAAKHAAATVTLALCAGASCCRHRIALVTGLFAAGFSIWCVKLGIAAIALVTDSETVHRRR